MVADPASSVYVCWSLVLISQVFLNKIRFIVLIMGSAMFLGILLKELTEENNVFHVLFSLQGTLIKNFAERLHWCDLCLFYFTQA